VNLGHARDLVTAIGGALDEADRLTAAGGAAALQRAATERTQARLWARRLVHLLDEDA
jgi:hypothetical protein